MAGPSIPFDDRDGWIWLDGEFVAWREAKIHVLTHALHYASSVFEGERLYGGEIFKLTQHTKRLFRSAELLDMQIPFTVDEIDEACKQTCAKMGLTDGYVRPFAWRGAEVMGVASKGSKVHVSVAAWEWPSYFDPEEKKKGIRITWSKWKRPFAGDHPLGGQGGGPLHDLHPLQGRGRAGGLFGRPDAGLPRLCGRMHRRQHLLRQGRGDPHAQSPTAS